MVQDTVYRNGGRIGTGKAGDWEVMSEYGFPYAESLDDNDGTLTSSCAIQQQCVDT